MTATRPGFAEALQHLREHGLLVEPFDTEDVFLAFTIVARETGAATLGECIRLSEEEVRRNTIDDCIGALKGIKP